MLYVREPSTPWVVFEYLQVVFTWVNLFSSKKVLVFGRTKNFALFPRFSVLHKAVSIVALMRRLREFHNNVPKIAVEHVEVWW